MISGTLQLHLTMAALLFLAACERPAAHAPAEAKKSAAAPNFDGAFKSSARWDATKKAMVVALEIEPGFHAYTTGETVGRPLALEIAETSDYAPSGAIEYPKGVTKDLPLGRSVIVEGKTEIVAPLAPKPPEGDPAGKVARAQLRYQVCTETSCDRPRTTELAVTP